ncbi:hypothetical protein GCM10025782_09880 [Pedococcus ginsenosidimutans]|uniref:Uncharacterized protein n=2 Tax=Pedococcus ginsenosidimutans TaxID=490570 RepID=A0ABP8XXA4_9MICO
MGAVLAALLILLPAAMRGLTYRDVTDPLLYMGLPIIVLAMCVGAIVGAPAPRPQAEVWHAPVQRPSGAAMAAGGIVLLAVCALAAWVLLWGVGYLAEPPPGLKP